MSRELRTVKWDPLTIFMSLHNARPNLRTKTGERLGGNQREAILWWEVRWEMRATSRGTIVHTTWFESHVPVLATDPPIVQRTRGAASV